MHRAYEQWSSSKCRNSRHRSTARILVPCGPFGLAEQGLLFEPGVRISSPGSQNFRETAFFRFSIFCPHFLSFEEKRRRFGGEQKNIIPWCSMYYIKHKYTIRSGLWPVVFSPFHSTLHLIHRVVAVVLVSTYL